MRRQPEPGGGDQADALTPGTLDLDAVDRPEVFELRGREVARALPDVLYTFTTTLVVSPPSMVGSPHVRTGQTRNRRVGDQNRVSGAARVSDAEFPAELECRSDRQSAHRPLRSEGWAPDPR